MKDLRQLNQYRNKIAEKAVWGTTYSRSRVGIFSIPLNANETARAIADNGQNHPEWEHVSVSLPTRCLTWEEMCKSNICFLMKVKLLFKFILPKKTM